MKQQHDALTDLLIARALHGLTDEEQQALDLLALEWDEDSLRRMTAEVEAALALAGNATALRASGSGNGEAPPPGLRQRLEADADRFFGTAPSAVTDIGERRSRRRDGRPSPAGSVADADDPPGSRPPGALPSGGRRILGVGGWLGWAVAAMLLVVVWGNRPAPEPAPLSPSEARAALLAEAQTVNLPWAPSAWSEFEAVRGDVSWSDERQEGYLRLVGMPPNDPAEAQYQLWIVDPERDSEPVDGGVFDIPAGTDEVIVPVRAALPVDRPVAFAITRERPGGVVVSEGPLLVVASRG